MNGEYQVDDPVAGKPKIFGLLLAAFLILMFSFWAYYVTKVSKGASSESVPVNVEIARGSSAKEVAEQLNSQRVINNPWVFIVYAYLNNAENKIQAGHYELDRKQSISEIVEILTAGKVKPSERRITIIEGWSNEQISDHLVSRGLAAEDELNQILSGTDFEFVYGEVAAEFNYQGFLFPDTYEIGESERVSELVANMLANFETKFDQELRAEMDARDLSLREVIILASIIEKEVGRSSDKVLADQDFEMMQQERQIVASVFYNRLELGMPLQSDATVNYITGKSLRSVTLEDTKINSPYNTYLNRGLPPGPISNPGLDSLSAAVLPAETSYLYFLNTPDGTAYFAKTLEEHNANRAN